MNRSNNQSPSVTTKSLAVFCYFLAVYCAAFGIASIFQLSADNFFSFFVPFVVVPVLGYCAWKSYYAGQAYTNGQTLLGYERQISSIMVFTAYMGVDSWFRSEFFRNWPGLMSSSTSHILVLALAAFFVARAHRLLVVQALPQPGAIPKPGTVLLWGVGLSIVAGLLLFLFLATMFMGWE